MGRTHVPRRPSLSTRIPSGISATFRINTGKVMVFMLPAQLTSMTYDEVATEPANARSLNRSFQVVTLEP